MNIGILAVDSNFPNLALMKIDDERWVDVGQLCASDYGPWWNGIIHYVNMIKYMQLKFSLSHPTITIISMLTK